MQQIQLECLRMFKKNPIQRGVTDLSSPRIIFKNDKNQRQESILLNYKFCPNSSDYLIHKT